MSGLGAAPCAEAAMASCGVAAALFAVGCRRLGWPWVQIGGR